VSVPAFSRTEPPPHLLVRPKSAAQRAYDWLGAPLRMALLPDAMSERLGLTSLRAERMAAVLPELRGRVLDVGAGDNLMVRLYRRHAGRLGVDAADAEASVGIDVHDWGGGCLIVDSSAAMPFGDGEFDTVAFVACLNHIPERAEALREAHRVLRPGGRLVATMIGRFVGLVGHTIWWYSEDKHRDLDEHERWGLSGAEMRRLVGDAGFRLEKTDRFLFGLNTLYVARAI
jgi:ubiquinone/menaquinone biosynthesis C-methylase UbiE